jgi:hypothetical protein
MEAGMFPRLPPGNGRRSAAPIPRSGISLHLLRHPHGVAVAGLGGGE